MPIVFRRRCPNCKKRIPPMTSKCPICGVNIITMKLEFARVEEKGNPNGSTAKVKQTNLVSDFGFPDIYGEIQRAKERKIKKEKMEAGK